MIPAEEEVLAYHEALSNWGRWGPDDELGTLNHVTQETRLAAVRSVQSGIVVSCAQDILTTPPEPPSTGGRFGPVNRFMVFSGEGLADEHRVHPPFIPAGSRWAAAAEWIGLVFHGAHVTHVDALSHIFWDRRTYNGHPAETVNATMGATRLAVTAMRHGVVTRGVLVDAARLEGVEHLEPGTPVLPELIERAEAAFGFTVGEGDAVLLRTGYVPAWRAGLADGSAKPGWHAACLPYFHDRKVALVGADSENDVLPSGYDSMSMPVHFIGLASMGLVLLDGCDLEELAATCHRLGRYEFMFSLAPLRLAGGTGSPVNPLAVF